MSRSRKRTGLKTGHYRGEAGFGEGDGEAAVGNIVGGLHGAFGGESDEAFLETLLGGEVDGGWFTGDDAGDGLCIFGGGKFAPRRVSGGHDVSCPYGCRVYWASAIEDEDDIALITESNLEDAGGVVENAKNAYNGRRVDRLAESLVVKADVAAGDGRAKDGAGFGKAVDGLRKLPHHFGLFGAAEIETIRGGDGARAAGGHVAGGFRNGMHGANARIELAPTTVAVSGEREGALHRSRLRILDPHHSRVARAGAR